MAHSAHADGRATLQVMLQLEKKLFDYFNQEVFHDNNGTAVSSATRCPQAPGPPRATHLQLGLPTPSPVSGRWAAWGTLRVGGGTLRPQVLRAADTGLGSVCTSDMCAHVCVCYCVRRVHV